MTRERERNGYQWTALIMALVSSILAFVWAGLLISSLTRGSVFAGIGVLSGRARGFMIAVTAGLFVQALFALIGGVLTLKGNHAGPALLWIAFVIGLVDLIGTAVLAFSVMSIFTFALPLLTAIIATVGVVKYRNEYRHYHHHA